MEKRKEKENEREAGEQSKATQHLKRKENKTTFATSLIRTRVNKLLMYVRQTRVKGCS